MGMAMSYLRVPPVLEGERDPAAIARLLFGAADWRRKNPAASVLDLGGTWQALHYLITGDPWDGRPPESDVVCGGRLLTEDGAAELGMDVIYLAPDRVKPAADHLASTPYGDLADRYDRAAMAAAGVQDADALKPEPQSLRPAYDGLGRFFQAASDEGQAIYKVMTDRA
ncbi:hypothetical protein Acsp03_09060 [Actinomadura sp. NBRC 104412]|nr:hypothetical protein Acsp03_09060 [Actinomadura sp. NBRC 104412]